MNTWKNSLEKEILETVVIIKKEVSTGFISLFLNIWNIATLLCIFNEFQQATEFWENTQCKKTIRVSLRQSIDYLTATSKLYETCMTNLKNNLIVVEENYFDTFDKYVAVQTLVGASVTKCLKEGCGSVSVSYTHQISTKTFLYLYLQLFLIFQ